MDDLQTILISEADDAMSASSRNYILPTSEPVLLQPELIDLSQSQNAFATFWLIEEANNGNNNSHYTSNSTPCEICFGEDTGLVGLDCGHEFCSMCLRSHVAACQDNGLYPAPCPSDKCQTNLSFLDVRSVASNEEYQRYYRLTSLRTNKTLSSCPSCSALQTCDPPTSPEILCDECGVTYCFYHSLAHTNRTCAEYMVEISESSALAYQLLSKTAKPCPSCSAYIELTGGCLHVKCTNCRTSFCYKCGTVLQGTFFPVCETCQQTFVEHRYLPLWAVLWLLALPIWIGYTLITGLIALIFLPCILCCFDPAMKTNILVLCLLPFIVLFDTIMQVTGWNCGGICSSCLAEEL